MTKGGLILSLASVFVAGGLGGAIVLHAAISSDRQERRTAAAPTETSHAGVVRIRVDEVRAERGELGVGRSPTNEAAVSESEVGIPLSDVLSELERDYQASLRNQARVEASQASHGDEVAAQPVPIPAQPAPSEIGAAAPPQPAQERVTVVSASDVGQVNVNPNNVNVTTVTEDHSVALSVSAPYPYYAPTYVPNRVVDAGQVVAPVPRGVYPRPAPASAPGKRYDSFHPPAGGDSPMFPAHASASLGPIFGGLP